MVLRTITRDDLRVRLRDRDGVVLDVRPEAEFAAGHIRGAVSIPIAELKSRLGDIPDGTDVAAYCRGPNCVYADEAVRVFPKQGRRRSSARGRVPRVGRGATPGDQVRKRSGAKLVAGFQERSQPRERVEHLGGGRGASRVRQPLEHQPIAQRDDDRGEAR